MTQREYNQLKKSCFQIMFGYSACDYKGEEIYLKHLNFRDQMAIDKSYENYCDKGSRDGLPTEEERLKDLETNKEWTPKEEEELKSIKLFINDLKTNKTNLFLKSQIELVNKDIEAKEKEYKEKLEYKLELIGITADSYAGKRLNNDYILNSFFTDSDLKKRLFTDEEFQNFDNKEIGELIWLYNKESENFNDRSVKRVTVSPFFQNIFSLCEDDSFKFFGKPVIELTYYQQNMFSYARYFKRLLSENKAIPMDLFDDPDRLIDFVTASKNMESKVNENEGRGSLGIAGATKEDLAAAGIVGVSLEEAAKKKGGSLTMADLLAMERGL